MVLGVQLIAGRRQRGGVLAAGISRHGRHELDFAANCGLPEQVIATVFVALRDDVVPLPESEARVLMGGKIPAAHCASMVCCRCWKWLLSPAGDGRNVGRADSILSKSLTRCTLTDSLSALARMPSAKAFWL